MRNWVRLRNVGSDRRMRVPRDGGTWPRCRRAARPGRVPRQHIEPHASTPGTTGAKGTGGTEGPGCGARGRWRGLAEAQDNAPSQPSAHQAPLVWRAPEGPEGTGGLRGAAPNEVRTPSLAGGPPPTGTHSGRDRRRPEHQRSKTQPRHNKAARPHRGRAAQPGSEAHRRTTTMSGSPRPLSWRTLEIPSLAATSFAVPSMRGSS